MQNKASTLALLAGMVFTGSAQATLLDRGNGLIYDDVLNITWLQDANYTPLPQAMRPRMPLIMVLLPLTISLPMEQWGLQPPPRGQPT
jgi:hypothetical protein